MSNMRSWKLETYFNPPTTSHSNTTTRPYCILCHCHRLELSKDFLEQAHPIVCNTNPSVRTHEIEIKNENLLIVDTILKIFYDIRTPSNFLPESTIPSWVTPLEKKDWPKLKANPEDNIITEFKTNIIGNRCSGKTSFAKVLPEYKEEDIAKWNHESSGRMFLHDDNDIECMNDYLFDRCFNPLIKLLFMSNDFLASDDKIQVVGPLGMMARVIALFLLEKISVQDLFQYMQSQTSLNLKKYKLIYINTDPKVCLHRIEKRGIPQEKEDYNLKTLLANQASMNLLYIFHQLDNPATIIHKTKDTETDYY